MNNFMSKNEKFALAITSAVALTTVLGLFYHKPDTPQEVDPVTQEAEQMVSSQPVLTTYKLIEERFDTTVYNLTTEEFKEYYKLKQTPCSDLKLSQKQLRALAVVKVFAKPHKLVNTMTAIALQESSLNNLAVNSKSGALGLGQILPATARSIAIQRNEYLNDEDLAMKLTGDIRLNLEYMLDVIQYFTKVNSKEGYVNHNRVWLGYYAGHSYNDSTGYDRDIANNIKLLKQCRFI